jgi:GntR family transcriptional repressor for pyruvate dehydrogenase complex
MTAAVLASDKGTAAGGGLVERVIDAVNAHVRLNRLGPGDGLPSENALALQLGVSRAVVREALRSMAALKLVDIGNGRRARVSKIDESVLGLVLDHAVHTDQITIQQIYDVRRTIEMRTVALAALRREDHEAAAIEALAAAMRRDFHQSESVMAHDIAFHETIARVSRNPMFALIVGSFHAVTRQTWPIGWTSRATDAERMASVEGHEAIARAIAARDHRAAQEHMSDHFDLSVKALVAAGVN